MVLRQYLQIEPVVAASYLLGCAGKGQAVVVDPLDPIERYLNDAERFGVAIRYVIDTHVHADHLSAGREISALTGAEYILAAVSSPSTFRGVQDGDVLRAGNVSLEVLHTPGHTPEHISLLVTDHTRADEPWAVLTGHTLMVGDMGRTELASSAEVGARALFESARRLRKLPDHVEILPGAFSGSVCGRGLSGKPASTIGFEKRYNRAFRIEDVEAFVALMISDVPPRPAQADAMRVHNLGALAARA